jgi:fucose permease
VPAVLTAAVGLALIGFAGLLVPSLVPAIETRFGQTDAGLGLALFITASAYVLGSFAGGFVTEGTGRRPVLVAAAVVAAAGLVGEAAAGAWPAFVAAAALTGLGSGAIDGGMNGLVLDAYVGRASGKLNAAHLGFGAGALAAPFVVGQVVSQGIDWQALFAATALLALGFALVAATTAMPPGRRIRAPEAHAPPPRTPPVLTSLPFLALAVAIAAYVSAEVGVSSWLVRFLSAAPFELATAALGVYWGGLTLGRLFGALTGDRIPPVPFAVVAVLGAAAAIVGAVAAHDVLESVILFGLAGFASGPVFPVIMAIAGERYPGRSALVAGSLAGVALVGAVVYPPLMGLLSETVGIGGGMLGAAALGGLCAAALLVAHRAQDAAAAQPRRRQSPL